MRACREQDELTRQVEACVSEQERKDLQREQERLLLKMERKGEQISKLYKHKAQVGPHTRRISFCCDSRALFILVSPF